MKVVLSARVEEDIARQLQFGIDRYGHTVAERTFARVEGFLFQFLAANPRSGKYLEDRGIYEVWIARTPFVVFYRVSAEEDTITVLALFHHAQDRKAFDPED
jgi:plasmid stabilization system protein ParE